jgi:hypothetical protein
MKKYKGSCHCGQVKFTIEATIDKVVLCNCSICRKKGALHYKVTPSQFNLVSGLKYLTLYQFDTKEARHYFCKVCGIHPFSQPRIAPDMYSINIKCLDDFPIEKASFETIKFDGKNWAQAAKLIK